MDALRNEKPPRLTVRPAASRAAWGRLWDWLVLAPGRTQRPGAYPADQHSEVDEKEDGDHAD